MNIQRRNIKLSSSREATAERLARGYEMERLGMRDTVISRALGYAGHSGWQNLKRAHELKIKKALASEKQYAANLTPRQPIEENALVEKICMAFSISRDDLDSMIDLYLSVKTGV